MVILTTTNCPRMLKSLLSRCRLHPTNFFYLFFRKMEILLVIIVVLAAGIGIISFNSMSAKKPTKIKITSDKEPTKEDNFP